MTLSRLRPWAERRSYWIHSVCVFLSVNIYVLCTLCSFVNNTYFDFSARHVQSVGNCMQTIRFKFNKTSVVSEKVYYPLRKRRGKITRKNVFIYKINIMRSLFPVQSIITVWFKNVTNVYNLHVHKRKGVIRCIQK